MDSVQLHAWVLQQVGTASVRVQRVRRSASSDPIKIGVRHQTGIFGPDQSPTDSKPCGLMVTKQGASPPRNDYDNQSNPQQTITCFNKLVRRIRPMPSWAGVC